MSRILAIDLGKFMSVTCLLDTATNETEFWTMSTDQPYLKAVLNRYKPNLAVIESCTIAGWVHDVCTAKGHKVLICNPNQEAWKWKHIKRETDRDDALKIAKLAALDQLIPCIHAVRATAGIWPVGEVPHGRRARGVRIKNNIRVIFQRRGSRWSPDRPPGRSSDSIKLRSIANRSAIANITSCGAANWTWNSASSRSPHSERRGREEASRTVDGRQTSPAPRNHSRRGSQNGRSRRGLFGQSSTLQKCAAGLVPRRYQSGLMDRQGRIHKRGPRLLRTALVEAPGSCNATIRGPKRSIKESAPTRKTVRRRPSSLSLASSWSAVGRCCYTKRLRTGRRQRRCPKPPLTRSHVIPE